MITPKPIVDLQIKLCHFSATTKAKELRCFTEKLCPWTPPSRFSGFVIIPSLLKVGYLHRRSTSDVSEDRSIRCTNYFSGNNKYFYYKYLYVLATKSSSHYLTSLGYGRIYRCRWVFAGALTGYICVRFSHEWRSHFLVLKETKLSNVIYSRIGIRRSNVRRQRSALASPDYWRSFPTSRKANHSPFRLAICNRTHERWIVSRANQTH
jgi:hypothetical protein